MQTNTQTHVHNCEIDIEFRTIHFCVYTKQIKTKVKRLIKTFY